MPVNVKNVSSEIKNSSIIGTYAGEALDCRITNNNGLDITDEVIETVLESEEYKQGIENGWFIGFLGHPEDPNCMDFRNGCIVLTDMTINDDGKVYATFNLIDTPVGQIVKKFIDAGVKFGISIRGAGDIIGNSVEPETFVFRGYDLVSFPAYPESIPTFTEIAASTNLEDQKKYKSICAAVQKNITSITSASTINVLQSQFAPQSKEYMMLDERRSELTGSTDLNLDKEKLEAMTQLYLEASQNVHDLACQVERLKRSNSSTVSACNRKVASIKRIMGSQLSDALHSIDASDADNRRSIRANDTLTRDNRVLSRRNAALEHEIEDLNEQISAAKKENLIYKQRVNSSTTELRRKDKIISSLQAELHETVTASSEVEESASNLDEENKNLKSEIRACKSLLRSYQDAYASMYSSALGVNLGPLSINSSTSVNELQKLIGGATNTVNMPSTVTVEPVYLADEDVDGDLVTM